MQPVSQRTLWAKLIQQLFRFIKILVRPFCFADQANEAFLNLCLCKQVKPPREWRYMNLL